jgi:uncharacterized protein YwgA
MQINAKMVLYMLANEFRLARNTTEERVELQKTIYLLQAYGVQLGYGFSWYKYGPYSQDLVGDAYTVLHAEKARYAAETKDLVFSESSRNRFREFGDICQEIAGIEKKKLKKADQLELVASVDFLRRTWLKEVEGTEFIESFKKHKSKLYHGPEVTDSMVTQAVAIAAKIRGDALR